MQDVTLQFATVWSNSFLHAVQTEGVRELLRSAGVAEDLKTWTSHMTDGVVVACRSLGWQVAAKGHRLDLLPQAGQEYLSLDAMAFNPDTGPTRATWHWPIGVFELENRHDDDRTAYSLWKVLNVSAPLRVVLAYRRTWDDSNALPGVLSDTVITASMPVERWNTNEGGWGGEVILVVGSRSDSDSFPWDYFRFWRLDRGIGRFVRLAGVSGTGGGANE